MLEKLNALTAGMIKLAFLLCKTCCVISSHILERYSMCIWTLFTRASKDTIFIDTLFFKTRY